MHTVYEDGTVSTLADAAFIEEEKYKNFDELIEFLDAKNYATLKVFTKPRMY